jgi:hypothetical protein
MGSSVKSRKAERKMAIAEGVAVAAVLEREGVFSVAGKLQAIELQQTP